MDTTSLEDPAGDALIILSMTQILAFAEKYAELMRSTPHP